jgi:XTP/dITP diphosphohydrolase
LASDPAERAADGVRLDVVLATSNRGKLRDFRHLFESTGIELSLPEDHDIVMDVEETGTTFEENAVLKARAIHDATGLAVLADDSGLVVEALGGEPGVYSARYAGPQCDDHANNLEVIAGLEGVDDRRAAFVCVLALVLGDGSEIVTDGRCEGRIIDEERGANGFGYDAIFFRDDLGCTFGEATPAEKNERSHRGAAVRAMLDELRRRGLARSASR